MLCWQQKHRVDGVSNAHFSYQFAAADGGAAAAAVLYVETHDYYYGPGTYADCYFYLCLRNHFVQDPNVLRRISCACCVVLWPCNAISA